jgi:hypothetical protein
MNEFEMRGDSLPLVGWQSAKQMIAVQIGLKRQHDRSSHEAVLYTTPLSFFNPALRFPLPAAWLAARNMQTGPVNHSVDALGFNDCFDVGYHCADYLARTVPIDWKINAGAAQRGAGKIRIAQNVRFCFKSAQWLWAAYLRNRINL